MNQGLLQILRKDFSPNQFEHLIADLWTLQDWNTQVTAQSNDKGIDVVATQDFPYKQKILIQAKKYGERSRVSSPEMQKYASLKQRDEVDSVIIVTTSEFTGEAKSIAEEFNLKCINGKQLLKFIHRLEAEQLVRDYASEDAPSPTVERPSYPSQESNDQQLGEVPTTSTPEPVSVTAEGVDISMKAVGLSRGRSLEHYLTHDISVVEEKISLGGKKTFEGRVVVFIEITNMGDKVDARPSTSPSKLRMTTSIQLPVTL
ncbi:restriction endonuclease [Saliphagus sp. GCM10025308]